MIQGTCSDVGKSLLVAGLARAFTRRGLKVRPFKPQNMSNNAAVTADGGEIGRAQALQARAARVPLSVHMNPVLLKPQSDVGAQVVVQGKVMGNAKAREYQGLKPRLLGAVLDSFGRLAGECDLVLVEGAGSASEVNLRANDIANMGFARAADVPVVLVGDIDRGGVIASLVGTKTVIEFADAEMIVGFIVNRFRGDPSLFDDGMKTVRERTGWPALGLVPYFTEAHRLPAEDAVILQEQKAGHADGRVRIAVLVYPRIANFDDFDPLRLDPGVDLVFVGPHQPVPGDAKLVILPGSKSTIGDLVFLRQQGWDIDIKAHARRGGHVLGLCGGYQMLGRTVADPLGIEGPAGSVEGLGLLDVVTEMTPDKSTIPVQGRDCATGAAVSGYEIHLGRTEGADCARPMLMLGERPDGAESRDGRVRGTYVHGLFTSDEFRRAWLAQFSVASQLAYEERIEQALDALADHLDAHLDVDRIVAIARSRQSASASAA
jgi:adenosylcobyric acid synthase